VSKGEKEFQPTAVTLNPFREVIIISALHRFGSGQIIGNALTIPGELLPLSIAKEGIQGHEQLSSVLYVPADARRFRRSPTQFRDMFFLDAARTNPQA